MSHNIIEKMFYNAYLEWYLRLTVLSMASIKLMFTTKPVSSQCMCQCKTLVLLLIMFITLIIWRFLDTEKGMFLQCSCTSHDALIQIHYLSAKDSDQYVTWTKHILSKLLFLG